MEGTIAFQLAPEYLDEEQLLNQLEVAQRLSCETNGSRDAAIRQAAARRAEVLLAFLDSEQ